MFLRALFKPPGRNARPSCMLCYYAKTVMVASILRYHYCQPAAPFVLPADPIFNIFNAVEAIKLTS